MNMSVPTRFYVVYHRGCRHVVDVRNTRPGAERKASALNLAIGGSSTAWRVRAVPVKDSQLDVDAATAWPALECPVCKPVKDQE